MFELLTLLQTHKIRKHLPVVLFGSSYWNDVIDFDMLVRYGSISQEDLELLYRTDSVDDAYEFLISELSKYALAERGAIL